MVSALRSSVWALILIGSSAGAFAAERPNILFIMADQLRADALGCEGNAAAKTPNLDRLAAQGARFAHAYTSTPSCTPARSAVLTGLSPWRHGMLGMGQMAEHYPREMPAMMGAAGYHTIAIGKMHFYPQRNPHGFAKMILDESGRAQTPDFISDYRCWFASMAPTLEPDATGIGWNDYRDGVYAPPEELHPTRWTGDVAVRFLKDYRDEKPFFAFVSFARPHSPYDPPERFAQMHADSDVPPAAIGEWASINDRKAARTEHTLWRGNLGPEQARRSRRAYYGSVSFVDEQIGRILEALAARGLTDKTLIVFTADHGDMLGDHHLWRKTYAYEGSARIPVLVRWPAGLPAQSCQVTGEPAELRDMLPTFLEAAGATSEQAAFDGRSLLGPVRGESASWREYIDLEHNRCYGGSEHWNALTDGRAKYVFHSVSGREQLFDLQADPGELHELSPEPAHRQGLEAWRARMVEHLRPRGEAFVRDGTLVSPRKDMLYSPLFPKAAASAPAQPAQPKERRR